MKKLNKLLLVVALSIFPAVALAGGDTEKPKERRGRFSIMDKGERAPFSGVIYDALGNALILSERRKFHEEKALALEELREVMQANFQKEYDLLASKKQAQKEKFEGIVAAKDKQIKQLEKEASKKGLPPLAWFGIGAGAGAAATALLILFVAL